VKWREKTKCFRKERRGEINLYPIFMEAVAKAKIFQV
jgi:hypothetical protein